MGSKIQALCQLIVLFLITIKSTKANQSYAYGWTNNPYNLYQQQPWGPGYPYKILQQPYLPNTNFNAFPYNYQAVAQQQQIMANSANIANNPPIPMPIILNPNEIPNTNYQKSAENSQKTGQTDRKVVELRGNFRVSDPQEREPDGQNTAKNDEFGQFGQNTGSSHFAPISISEGFSTTASVSLSYSMGPEPGQSKGSKGSKSTRAKVPKPKPRTLQNGPWKKGTVTDVTNATKATANVPKATANVTKATANARKARNVPNVTKATATVGPERLLPNITVKSKEGTELRRNLTRIEYYNTSSGSKVYFGKFGNIRGFGGHRGTPKPTSKAKANNSPGGTTGGRHSPPGGKRGAGGKRAKSKGSKSKGKKLYGGGGGAKGNRTEGRGYGERVRGQQGAAYSPSSSLPPPSAQITPAGQGAPYNAQAPSAPALPTDPNAGASAQPDSNGLPADLAYIPPHLPTQPPSVPFVPAWDPQFNTAETEFGSNFEAKRAKRSSGDEGHLTWDNRKRRWLKEPKPKTYSYEYPDTRNHRGINYNYYDIYSPPALLPPTPLAPVLLPPAPGPLFTRDSRKLAFDTSVPNALLFANSNLQAELRAANQNPPNNFNNFNNFNNQNPIPVPASPPVWRDENGNNIWTPIVNTVQNIPKYAQNSQNAPTKTRNYINPSESLVPVKKFQSPKAYANDNVELVELIELAEIPIIEQEQPKTYSKNAEITKNTYNNYDQPELDIEILEIPTYEIIDKPLSKTPPKKYKQPIRKTPQKPVRISSTKYQPELIDKNPPKQYKQDIEILEIPFEETYGSPQKPLKNSPKKYKHPEPQLDIEIVEIPLEEEYKIPKYVDKPVKNSPKKYRQDIEILEIPLEETYISPPKYVEKPLKNPPKKYKSPVRKSVEKPMRISSKTYNPKKISKPIKSQYSQPIKSQYSKPLLSSPKDPNYSYAIKNSQGEDYSLEILDDIEDILYDDNLDEIIEYYEVDDKPYENKNNKKKSSALELEATQPLVIRIPKSMQFNKGERFVLPYQFVIENK